MDIRFLIVGAPFIIAFLYTLYWLRKWGAFDDPKKMTSKDEKLNEKFVLENIFLIKN